MCIFFSWAATARKPSLWPRHEKPTIQFAKATRLWCSQLFLGVRFQPAVFWPPPPIKPLLPTQPDPVNPQGQGCQVNPLPAPSRSPAAGGGSRPDVGVAEEHGGRFGAECPPCGHCFQSSASGRTAKLCVCCEASIGNCKTLKKSHEAVRI